MDALHNSSSHHDNDTPWFVYECTLELEYDYRRAAIFLLYLLLFMVGLVENCVVLWVNWKRRRSCSTVLFCALNISMSDLMVVLMIPFYMLEVSIDKVWIWGHFLCKVTHLIYMVNFYSSSFFVACMTVERHTSLVRPDAHALGTPEYHRRALVCGGLWALALLLALVENAHVELLEWNEPGCFIMPMYNYLEWFATLTCLTLLFQFVVPTAVIITYNVLIARAVALAPDVHGRRDVWLVHLYSVVFVACWFPYHIVRVLTMVDDIDPFLFSCNTTEALYFSYSLVQCLTFFHCVANPILYNFLSKSFRDVLINSVMDYLTQKAGAGQAQVEAGAAQNRRRASTSSDTSHSAVNP